MERELFHANDAVQDGPPAFAYPAYGGMNPDTTTQEMLLSMIGRYVICELLMRSTHSISGKASYCRWQKISSCSLMKVPTPAWRATCTRSSCSRCSLWERGRIS